MLVIPHKLSNATELAVQATIDCNSDETQIDERLTFVAKTFRRKSKSLASVAPNWPSPVGYMAIAFFEGLRERRDSRESMKSSTAMLVFAALYYFCDSNDVIPDYSPGDGFDDHAHAFNYVLKIAKRRDKKCYEDICRRFLELANVSQ